MGYYHSGSLSANIPLVPSASVLICFIIDHTVISSIIWLLLAGFRPKLLIVFASTISTYQIFSHVLFRSFYPVSL